MAEKNPSAVLCAGDSFLTDKSFQSYSEQLKKSIPGEWAVHSFRLSDTPLDKIVSEARSLPFLTAAQVFRIRECEDLKEKNLESLEAYLEKPSDFSYLFFEAGEIERDNPLVELIFKKGKVMLLQAEDKKTAGSKFIHEKLRRAGKTISPPALAKLSEETADAPAFLDSLLEQLILYSGDQKEISEAMVDAFEENWRQNNNAFSLTDALGAQKTGRALKIVNELLEENGGDLVSLLGLLHWQVRRLWLARVLMDEGMPETMALKKCKISPKQAPFFTRQVKVFSRPKIEKILEGLFQLDWKVKTGRVEGPVGLESWIVEATSRI